LPNCEMTKQTEGKPVSELDFPACLDDGKFGLLLFSTYTQPSLHTVQQRQPIWNDTRFEGAVEGFCAFRRCDTKNGHSRAEQGFESSNRGENATTDLGSVYSGGGNYGLRRRSGASAAHCDRS
jgi:hypothetical protein